MNTRQNDGGDIKDAETTTDKPKEFANLTYDPGFKIVFGTAGQSEKLLMILLRRILNIPIVEVRYLPTERLGLTEEESRSFFDVYCTDENGCRFLIEMQMWSQHHFHKRAVYYSSLSVQDQARVEMKYQKEVLRRKKWNYYFAPVYVVSFLNFPNSIVEGGCSKSNPYIAHYVYRDKETGRELRDETNLVFVDLEKFRKGFSECIDACERWLYSIKNMHLLHKRPEGVAGTELEDLYREAEMAAWPAEKRILYKKHMGTLNDYGNILEERYEDGMERGRAEVAANMLTAGMDIQQISQLTGFSVEEIRQMI